MPPWPSPPTQLHFLSNRGCFFMFNTLSRLIFSFHFFYIHFLLLFPYTIKYLLKLVFREPPPSIHSYLISLAPSSCAMSLFSSCSFNFPFPCFPFLYKFHPFYFPLSTLFLIPSFHIPPLPHSATSTQTLPLPHSALSTQTLPLPHSALFTQILHLQPSAPSPLNLTFNFHSSSSPFSFLNQFLQHSPFYPLIFSFLTFLLFFLFLLLLFLTLLLPSFPLLMQNFIMLIPPIRA